MDWKDQGFFKRLPVEGHLGYVQFGGAAKTMGMGVQVRALCCALAFMFNDVGRDMRGCAQGEELTLRAWVQLCPWPAEWSEASWKCEANHNSVNFGREWD